MVPGAILRSIPSTAVSPWKRLTHHSVSVDLGRCGVSLMRLLSRSKSRSSGPGLGGDCLFASDLSECVPGAILYRRLGLSLQARRAASKSFLGLYSSGRAPASAIIRNGTCAAIPVLLHSGTEAANLLRRGPGACPRPGQSRSVVRRGAQGTGPGRRNSQNAMTAQWLSCSRRRHSEHPVVSAPSRCDLLRATALPIKQPAIKSGKSPRPRM